MLELAVTNVGFDPIIQRVNLLETFDLSELSALLGQVLITGTIRDRIEGRAEGGGFLDPITESTAQRRRRAGKGEGEPLVPDEDLSRFANPELEIQSQLNGYKLIILWPQCEEFIDYHIHGTQHMVDRNPVFISEETWEEIYQTIREYFQGLFGGMP